MEQETTQTIPGQDPELPPRALYIPSHRKYYRIDEDELVIGSAPNVDIVLADPFVSSRHCAVHYLRGKVAIRDLGSKNGTYIDHKRLSRAELRAGSHLRVGDTRLRVVHDIPHTQQFGDLIGSSPALMRAVSVARSATTSNCNVLILGETGTGKELFARAIHGESQRHAGPFIDINCGAIPTSLIESELFGHERGAFTGAETTRDGLFVRGHLGTLFLDELGELPIPQQPHLLRALETGTVTRVGGRAPISFDTRIIAATHVLNVEHDASALRRDLFHRIATLIVHLPPLRSRRGDILPMVHSFMEEFACNYGDRRLSNHAGDALLQHAWPGNVRELRQAVHRAMVLSEDTIETHHLFPRATVSYSCPPKIERLPHSALENTIRNTLKRAYDRHGSVRAAATALGMPRSTFASKAKRYGITLNRRGQNGPTAVLP